MPDDKHPSKGPSFSISSVDRLIEQSRRHQEELDDVIEKVKRQKQEGVDRELEGLRHAAAMVEQQRHILEAQRDLQKQQEQQAQRQAHEGRADRRIQYAILTFTASALVAGIVFGVYTVTRSEELLWVTLAVASAVVAGIALWVVPGRRRKGAPADPAAAE